MDIVKTVTDWPVIVQGALGSALFWAILEIGQRIARRVAARLGSDKETANWFALAGHEASGEAGARARFFCIYGAMHYVLKALIVSVLSWVVSPLLDVVASVGYLIAAYFFFRALAFVLIQIVEGQFRSVADVLKKALRWRNPAQITSRIRKKVCPKHSSQWTVFS